MDINLLFKEGMRQCGRVLKVLPQDEIGSPKEYMLKVLREVTLPSLNKLYPRLHRIVVNMSDLQKIEGVQNNNYVGFRIPSELVGGLKIVGIKSLNSTLGSYGYENSGTPGIVGSYIGGGNQLSTYPNRFGRFSSANLYETVVSAQLTYADLQLMGQYQEAPIPRFEYPNILWINKPYANMQSALITFMLENDENLMSVDDHVYEGVKKLFILDLKSSIYGEYGILSSIETSMGTIDLKIEDWQGCYQERQELYDTYDAQSHLRRGTIIAG